MRERVCTNKVRINTKELLFVSLRQMFFFLLILQVPICLRAFTHPTFGRRKISRPYVKNEALKEISCWPQKVGYDTAINGHVQRADTLGLGERRSCRRRPITKALRFKDTDSSRQSSLHRGHRQQCTLKAKRLESSVAWLARHFVSIFT